MTSNRIEPEELLEREGTLVRSWTLCHAEIGGER